MRCIMIFLSSPFREFIELLIIGADDIDQLSDEEEHSFVVLYYMYCRFKSYRREIRLGSEYGNSLKLSVAQFLSSTTQN